MPMAHTQHFTILAYRINTSGLLKCLLQGVQKSEAGCEVLIVSDCSIRAAEDGEGVDSSSGNLKT